MEKKGQELLEKSGKSKRCGGSWCVLQAERAECGGGGQSPVLLEGEAWSRLAGLE